MAIYVTGDTHGSAAHGRFSVDGYIPRLSPEAFPEQKDLNKEDCLVILGDFGGVWGVSRTSFQEPPAEREALDWLEGRSFTTLFVPGNHENYDRLTGCRNEAVLNSWLYADMPDEEKQKLRGGYPRAVWHGGQVRVLRPSVMMLERGELFDIGGRHCFAFGGARSHDIRDGILDPPHYPDEEAFCKDYLLRRSGLIRVRGISWWDEEMPSRPEMERGRKTISAFMRQHDRIDFVFTHEAPASDKILLGYDPSDELSRYLESLRNDMKYGKWFYGHYHDNRMVSPNHYLLYEQILRIH